jgi:hypothetical protein
MVRMPTELTTSIDIDSGPDEVWQVLTDLAAYPRWNPFITSAEGPVEVGSRLVLRMQPVGARPVTVRPTVLEAVPGRWLRWLGRLGMPGLFDADHTFTISDRAGGGVHLSQSEQFRGVLVPLMARSLRRHTLPAFAAMNDALKRRVEHTPVDAAGPRD